MLTKDIRPVVRFDYRQHGIDAEQSQIAGRPVPRRVVFVFVLSSGGTEFEAIAEEWLVNKRKQAIQGSYNPDWVDYFEKQYAAWKDGQTLPVDGTPILSWQMIADQNIRQRIITSNVTTVEQLAEVPDGSLNAQAIGLDWRVWRDMARAWVAEGKDKGINAQKVADLEEQVRSLAAQVSEWHQKAIAASAEEHQPRRGRPPKELAAA